MYTFYRCDSVVWRVTNSSPLLFILCFLVVGTLSPGLLWYTNIMIRVLSGNSYLYYDLRCEFNVLMSETACMHELWRAVTPRHCFDPPGPPQPTQPPPWFLYFRFAGSGLFLAKPLICRTCTPRVKVERTTYMIHVYRYSDVLYQ